MCDFTLPEIVVFAFLANLKKVKIVIMTIKTSSPKMNISKKLIGNKLIPSSPELYKKNNFLARTIPKME